MSGLSENAERELRQQVKDIVENDYGIIVYFYDLEEETWSQIIREGGEACGNDFALCFVRLNDKICKILIRTNESENDKLLVRSCNVNNLVGIVHKLVKPEDLTELLLRVLILKDD